MDNVKVLLKAIIRKDGKLLALKRPADAFSRPNCWDFPGGNLEFGERASKCLEREIIEETELQVKNLSPLHLISELDSKGRVFWIEVGYACDYDKGDVKLSAEHIEHRWLTKDQFLNLESAEYLKEFARRL